MNPDQLQIELVDQQPTPEMFLEEVLAGLREPEKRLPCKYFYDGRGSELFEEICELDEYYLTRTELEIMSNSAGEIAELIGPGAILIELGSGSSIKTRILLDELESPAAYVPIDIARDHLAATTSVLSGDYPDLNVLPVCADFTERFELPETELPVARNVVFFPGSTIGNFEPHAAQTLLERINELCQPDGGLLIGMDLKKDVAMLEAAYNDSEGVTRDFNLNLLQRINRELAADFITGQFRHLAFYNEIDGCIEMHLVSSVQQTVTIDQHQVTFEQGEMIRTEHSYKYDFEQIRRLATSAGLDVKRYWTDDQRLFGIFYLAIKSNSFSPATA